MLTEMQILTAFGEAQVAAGHCTAADLAANQQALQAHLDNGGSLSNFEGPPDGPASAAAPVPPQQAPPTPTAPDPADAAVFAGASSPAEYRFGPAPTGVETSLDQEIAIRNMLHQHEIPAALGSEVGRLWNQACANPPDAVAMEVGRQKCAITLRQAWGDGYKQNLALAQREVSRMAQTSPEIVGMLEASGLGNNPWLAMTLVNVARARGRA